MLKDHPQLQAMKIPVNSETKKYNTNGDDFITIEDFEADDYESLCKLLETKPDLAYGIIAEMMTLQQAKMRNQNKVKEDEETRASWGDKELGSNNGGSNRATGSYAGNASTNSSFYLPGSG